MRHLIAERREDGERADSGEYPHDRLEQRDGGVVQIACRCVHVGHELTHRACNDIPGKVDRNEEDDRLDVHRIGKRTLHHRDEALFCLQLLLTGPVGGFLQLALEIPRDHGHHEQDREQQTHGEQAIKRTIGSCGEQLATRGEGGEHEREDERNEEDNSRTA